MPSVIKNERVSAAAIKQGKVCQVLCMICVINFHYKVFINLFFLLLVMIALVVHVSRRDVRVFYARVVVSWCFSCRLLKISDDGEIFWHDSVNYKQAWFFCVCFF